MNRSELLFEGKEIYKSFGITKALQGVHIQVRRGQVMGLVGENGSGKSTLGTIISAIQQADSGEMRYKGEIYNPVSNVASGKLGICMILQENGTFDKLSVAKNIFIGREDMFRKNGLIDNSAMNRAAREALDNIHAAHIQETTLVEQLTFEDKKLIELARAMWMKPELLIADETTTALSRNGRDILYRVIENLTEAGGAVIFISHDIEELMEKCDALTILKDGTYVAELDKKDFEANKIKGMMVGRKAVDNFYRTDTDSCMNSEIVLQVEHASTEIVKDVSFSLQKGEILGFAGIADSGIHEIGYMVYGLSPLTHGNVKLNGQRVDSPRSAMRGKMGYLSKNRDNESLMIASSIRDNICLPSYKKLSRGRMIRPSTEKRFAVDMCKELNVKMQDINQFVLELSGGNKQKIVIAKWLGFGADTLILDCPTRGIDIGVKANIYDLMCRLKAEGKSMILISEELPEVIGMSDRVIVMKKGRINGEFLREEGLSEAKLIKSMV